MYLSLSPPAPSSFSFRLFVSPLSSSFSSRRPIVADGESSCVRLERKGNRNFVALCFLFHRGRTRNGYSSPRSATRTEEEENLLRFLPPIIELESFARMEGLKESASETKSWGQRRGCSRQRDDGDLAVRSKRKDIIKLRRERIPGREEGLVGRFVRKILFDYRFFEEEFSKSLETDGHLEEKFPSRFSPTRSRERERYRSVDRRLINYAE